MYLAGAYASQLFSRIRPEGYPAWMYVDAVPVLSRIGKLSLPIYLIHQPLLIVIFELVCR